MRAMMRSTRLQLPRSVVKGFEAPHLVVTRGGVEQPCRVRFERLDMTAQRVVVGATRLGYSRLRWAATPVENVRRRNNDYRRGAGFRCGANGVRIARSSRRMTGTTSLCRCGRLGAGRRSAVTKRPASRRRRRWG